MSQVNLTHALRTNSSAGSLLPWESPYTTEPIATLDHNGANLFHIEMSPAAGTRIMGARIADPRACAIRDIPAETILNRSTTVVAVTAGPDAVIDSVQLDAALAKSPAREGDALLLITGWGDSDESEATGEGAQTRAPRLSVEAIQHLRRFAREIKSDLVLIDIPYLQGLQAGAVQDEWLSLAPWLRPSWPSSSAKAYMRHYTSGSFANDWAPTLELLEDVWLVCGLRNCGQLSGNHTTLNVLPFQVEGVGEAPCTVVGSLES